MIPKRAFTWWCGPEPMTPLHQASLRSFKRWHPDWDVTVHWGEDGPDARRRSDVWRWRNLTINGGVWFDADVIWYGSIEPYLGVRDAITMDLGTPGADGRAFSIGVCAGTVSDLYLHLWGQAQAALADPSDQSTGTEILAKPWPEPFDVDNLPGHLFYRVPPTLAGMKSLWEPGAAVELGGIGMHWYGSQYQGEPHPDSPIGRALAKAFA